MRSVNLRSDSCRYDPTRDPRATWSVPSAADSWSRPSERTLHYKHRLDYVFPNRLSVSNHSGAPFKGEYSPYVWTGGMGKVGRHTHTVRAALLGTGTWGGRGTGGHKREGRGGARGAREKEKCLLNDIPIVRPSRTMALCKTANNERRRNPSSYRGPAACSPLP